MVRELASAALDLATEQALANYYTDATIIQGWLMMQEDQPGEASRIMTAALAERQDRGTLFLQPFYLGLLAQAHLMDAKENEALSTLTDATECADRSGECWFNAELARLRGEVLVSLGQHDEAEACFHTAIRTARSFEIKGFELRAATSLARLWAEKGERSQARDLLQPVHDWFTEGFDTVDFKHAKTVLEQVCS